MFDIEVLHGYGGGGLKSSEKTDLINVVNGAVSNQDTVKTGIINAMNSKLATTLTADKTWTEIQSALNGYSGKRWASGTMTSSSTTMTYADSNGNDNTVHYYVALSGLNFIPSVIVLSYQSYLLYCAYDAGISKTGSWGNIKTNTTNLRDTKNFSIGNGAYQMPTNASNVSHRWIAFE